MSSGVNIMSVWAEKNPETVSEYEVSISVRVMASSSGEAILWAVGKIEEE